MNDILRTFLPDFNVEIISLQLYNKEIRNEILLNLMNYIKLTYFTCDNCNLTELPILPNTITSFYCCNNNLTYLPDLPEKLETFMCSNNNLTYLPDLPETLKCLNCQNNKLTYLPDLPKILIILDCYNNNLIELPEIPNSLESLFCYKNNLTYLPDLPKLIHLSCIYNKLNSRYFKNTIYDEYDKNDDEYKEELEEYEEYAEYSYFYDSRYPFEKIKIINEMNSKYRIHERLKILNRILLLEHSAIICLNPKRIKRLLDNLEINFYDGSFDTLTN